MKRIIVGAATLVALASSARGASTDKSLATEARQLLARRCFTCHGPDAKARKGGLRLDDRAAFTKTKDGEVAILPGKPSHSTAWQRITTIDLDDRMPPPDSGPALTPSEQSTLKRWIESGAPWVGHWAFEPIADSPLPSVAKPGSHPIDVFVAARLHSAGMSLSPEAPRASLLRRVSLDLIGLPPTPDEVMTFLSDRRPDAYERKVDALFRSPHFGERWARPWLDLARYADSNGYSIDGPRVIWPYRDWVIDALNADKPYDSFVIEQLAGDLLPGATVAQRIATGFQRNTMTNEEGGIDQEQFRVEAVADRVATLGSAFLGLTIGCARCHDHKFDPISQREFYALFAFWNDQDEVALPLGSKSDVARAAALTPQLLALERELKLEESAWQKSLSDTEKKALPEPITVILNLSPEQRDPGQWQRLFGHLRPLGLCFSERIATIEDLRKRRPSVPTSLVLEERKNARKTTIHLGGDFARPGAAVSPGVPAVLLPFASDGRPDRLALARWLVDKRQALVHRVAVNRHWQALFGTGLVSTENDFGTQGEAPTHPELLDYLTARWTGDLALSSKNFLRLIVTSRTYKQASTPIAAAVAVDPRNRLLWRQNRMRLDAELVRDSALRAAGVLSPKLGGPPVYPPQPEGVFGFTQIPRQWVPSVGADRYRRGIYTFLWRSAPHPALATFDAPDATASCTRRNRSTTPLQALTLLNDSAFMELAQHLGQRMLRWPGSSARRLAQGARRRGFDSGRILRNGFYRPLTQRDKCT